MDVKVGYLLTFSNVNDHEIHFDWHDFDYYLLEAEYGPEVD